VDSGIVKQFHVGGEPTGTGPHGELPASVLARHGDRDDARAVDVFQRSAMHVAVATYPHDPDSQRVRLRTLLTGHGLKQLTDLRDGIRISHWRQEDEPRRGCARRGP